MALEMPELRKHALKSIKTDTTVAVSWEYLYLLSDVICFDHIIVSDCTDQRKWYDRLFAKSQTKGFVNPSLSVIESIVKGHRFDTIIPSALKVWGDKCIVVDTSADDWGAENLRIALKKLF